MRGFRKTIAQLVAWATLMGRVARVESLAPKTIKIPRRRGKLNLEQECARRLRQKSKYGEKHGAPTWQGCWALKRRYRAGLLAL
jgi:hypothetical protein